MSFFFFKILQCEHWSAGSRAGHHGQSADHILQYPEVLDLNHGLCFLSDLFLPAVIVYQLFE